MATAMYVRDTALKFKSQNMDLARAALNNIQVVRPQFNGAYMPNMNQNPYSVNINGRNEDLSWLL